jgi:hypothetical protein
MNRALCLLLLIGLPALAAVQEKSTLETAKGELSTLPAANADIDQARIALPRIDAPSAPSAGSAFTPPPDRSKRTDQPWNALEGSKNWLVDAMAKESNRMAGRRGQTGDRTPEKDRARPFAVTNEDEPSPNNSATAKAVPAAHADPGRIARKDNPLIPFMADWISKADQALLLPKSSPGPMFDGSQAFVPPGSSSDLPPATMLGDYDRPTAISEDPARHTADNPYLNIAKGVPAALPKPVPRQPGRTGQLMMPAEKPKERNEALAPFDLSKPAQDVKYYPQLKRF